MQDILPLLQREKAKIDEALDAELPSADIPPALLHEAMRYSVLNGGKRIRPILCCAAASAAGGDRKKALLPGLALEILHSYTLVHDDLPCMDDDDLRRGRPTAHIVYGEAQALLAGDALLTLAFEWMGRCPAPEPWPSGQPTIELARYTGSRGTIGGQVEDLAGEEAEPSRDRIEFIHLNKTAALLEVSCRLGSMVSGGSVEQTDALGRYARDLGLAFQIIDDILDEEGDTETLGKPAGSDSDRGKMTYPALFGIEESRRLARETMEQSLAHLDRPDLAADELRAIAQFIIDRNN
jgi:geranylgeranyl diphosphate synthase type II